MATVINSSTTGLTVTPDNSGQLTLSANGVTALTANTTGYLNFAKQPTIGGVEWPAFRARPATSTQSVSNNTWTKVTLGTEEFDTNNNFASSRFTPTVAGYYQLNASLFCTNSGGNMTQVRCNIYKNGSDEVWGNLLSPVAVSDAIGTVSGIVYLNGSTDYVELYGYIGGSSTSPVFAGATNYTQFTGCLLRGA